MIQATTTRAASAVMCIAAAALTGCVATVPVKEMLGDREAFLAAQFAPAKLRPDVKAAVDKAAVPTPAFKSMKLSYRLANDDEGKKRDVEVSALVLNAGNGLFQRQDELSTNGFPYRINNELDYLGLRALIWQSAFHTRSNSELGYEVKQVVRLDSKLASAKAGDELVYEVATGTTQQIANYATLKVTCKAGDTVPASTVNAAFEGDALKLTCTRFDDKGIAFSKTENVYLKRYAFALTLEYTSSQVRNTYTYTKVEIRK
jgi:hypothetical protein